MRKQVVSREPFAKISAYKRRLGWGFPWVSSYGSDFNFDYHVSFTPEQLAEGQTYYNYGVHPKDVSDEQGISVFYKNESGEVFREAANDMSASLRSTCAGSCHAAALGAASWLSLAAAPTFAVMALLTGVGGGGPLDMLCSAAPDASPLNGMVLMYVLMSAFHSAPWLKLIANRRSDVGQS